MNCFRISISSYRVIRFLYFKLLLHGIRKPAVVGITSLGLDHTAILGNNISEIAWQKAGIMKPGTTAFTVRPKYAAALQVMKERARARNVLF